MTTKTPAKPKLILGGDPDAKFERIPPAQFFTSWNQEFIASPELQEIAHALISAHEDKFDHMKHFTLRVVWKKKRTKDAMAKCIKTSGLVQFYGACDFVIWLAADHLRLCEATSYQVEAVVFHELLHTSVEYLEQEHGDPIPRPALNPHDFEGFCDEVTEYGLYFSDMKPIAKAFLQLELDLSAA